MHIALNTAKSVVNSRDTFLSPHFFLVHRVTQFILIRTVEH